jgi:hypothetical protein
MLYPIRLNEALVPNERRDSGNEVAEAPNRYCVTGDRHAWRRGRNGPRYGVIAARSEGVC